MSILKIIFLFETILFKDDDVFELGYNTLSHTLICFLIDIAKQWISNRTLW